MSRRTQKHFRDGAFTWQDAPVIDTDGFLYKLSAALGERDLRKLAQFLEVEPADTTELLYTKKSRVGDTDIAPPWPIFLEKVDDLIARLMAVRDELNVKMMDDRVERIAKRERMTR